MQSQDHRPQDQRFPDPHFSHPAISSQTDADLRPYHTFGITQRCAHLVPVHTVDEIVAVYHHSDWQALPKLMLGKGSNMLFTEPYQGVVMINELQGKQVSETNDHWRLHVAAGEDWPSLVEWSVKQGYAGLENLALIPGCAGSAPIQNIGAYGVEFKDVCEYVDILCLDSFRVRRLSVDECQFGYRDSVFKHDLYQKAIVVAVGLRLAKQWRANIQYGPLKDLGEQASPADIFARVCEVRREKLPDPTQQGNAGSFFKNPVIEMEHYQALHERYPDMVAYSAEQGMKVAAGWLIDQCGLKGTMVGGAQVHLKQALVLVNTGTATAEDVVALADKVCRTVYERYGIALEHEVRFMAAQKETRLSVITDFGASVNSKDIHA